MLNRKFSFFILINFLILVLVISIRVYPNLYINDSKIFTMTVIPFTDTIMKITHPDASAFFIKRMFLKICLFILMGGLYSTSYGLLKNSINNTIGRKKFCVISSFVFITALELIYLMLAKSAYFGIDNIIIYALGIIIGYNIVNFIMYCFLKCSINNIIREKEFCFICSFALLTIPGIIYYGTLDSISHFGLINVCIYILGIFIGYAAIRIIIYPFQEN